MAFLIIVEVMEDRRRKNIITAIEHFGDCIKFADSAYGLKTEQSLADVYDGLRLRLSSEDQLLVLPLTYPYTGGNTKIQQWLENNLTE